MGEASSTGEERVGALRIALLGPLAVSRGGTALALPGSRKVRALLGCLALEPRGFLRSRLCDMLWDAPADPRGELRWCLSRLRQLVDEPGLRRLRSEGETVSLELSDSAVDASEVARAAALGFDAVEPPQLRRLAGLFRGELLEGLDVDASPGFGAWVEPWRRRFHGWHVALLESVAKGAGDDQALEWLERWLQVAPFERRAHARLLAVLARQGRLREAQAHLAASARRFEAEGIDPAPLHEDWLAARAVAAVRPAVGGSDLADAMPIAGRDEPGARGAARRASIAVTAFVDATAGAGGHSVVAYALAHDVITRLAKLRALFVIAPGSVFALRERSVGAQEAGRLLDVDYLVTGSVRHEGRRLVVNVELAEARGLRVIWAEHYDQAADDALLVLDAIGDRIVASVAGEIENLECDRAVLRPPDSLDAWEAHHRGLWHMYRFSRPDNAQARRFFEMATRLDPGFSRAWAGLSFTHFQNAFQGWTARDEEVERALQAAQRSLLADERDPAAHWAMGRALWLQGRQDDSLLRLGEAVDLSPNFALGHYTLSFVQSQSGDPAAAIVASDESRRLSPFDPMLFGMLGTRAMALVRLERFDEAAHWASLAAARPNAHEQIFAMAAYALALDGRTDEARAQAERITRTIPGYRIDDFLRAYRFDPQGAALFREGARRIGMG